MPRKSQAIRLNDEQKALAERYVPLAWSLALAAAKKYPAIRDDLISDALEMVCRAAGLFDPSLGVGFGHYARIRISGAIMDRIAEYVVSPEVQGDSFLGSILDWASRDDLESYEWLCEGLRSERSREIVYRLAILEESQAEVAEGLGISTTRASVLIRRVIGHLLQVKPCLLDYRRGHRENSACGAAARNQEIYATRHGLPRPFRVRRQPSRTRRSSARDAA